MLRHYLLFLIAILPVSGCKAGDDLFRSMESSEKTWSEKVRRTSVSFMSLETMFPDKEVRSLAAAAGKGDIKKVRELVARGVDVNARGTSNATPLAWALRNFTGFSELLKQGADPNVIYDDGSSVMLLSVRMSDDRFLRELLKFGGDPNLASGQYKKSPLLEATGPDSKDKLGILIAAGANLNVQFYNGDTPMIVAAKLGQFDVVYELLEAGADYTLKNHRGQDLEFAIKFRKKTVDPNNPLTNWMHRVIEWMRVRGAYK